MAVTSLDQLLSFDMRSKEAESLGLAVVGYLASWCLTTPKKAMEMADLRPQNILASSSGAIMLNVRLTDTLRASQYVLPPERIEQDTLPPRGRPLAGLELPGRAAVFCIGCVLYSVLHRGEGPFDRATRAFRKSGATESEGSSSNRDTAATQPLADMPVGAAVADNQLSPFSPEISPNAKELCLWMLQPDPAYRPSLEEIVRHPAVHAHLRSILGTPTAARHLGNADAASAASASRPAGQSGLHAPGSSSGAAPAKAPPPAVPAAGPRIEQHAAPGARSASRRQLRPSAMLRLPTAIVSASAPSASGGKHSSKANAPGYYYAAALPGVSRRQLAPKVSLLRLGSRRRAPAEQRNSPQQYQQQAEAHAVPGEQQDPQPGAGSRGGSQLPSHRPHHSGGTRPPATPMASLPAAAQMQAAIDGMSKRTREARAEGDYLEASAQPGTTQPPTRDSRPVESNQSLHISTDSPLAPPPRRHVAPSSPFGGRQLRRSPKLQDSARSRDGMEQRDSETDLLPRRDAGAPLQQLESRQRAAQPGAGIGPPAGGHEASSPAQRMRQRKAQEEARKQEELRRAREQAFLDRLELQSRFADHIRRPGAQLVAGVLRGEGAAGTGPAAAGSVGGVLPGGGPSSGAGGKLPQSSRHSIGGGVLNTAGIRERHLSGRPTSGLGAGGVLDERPITGVGAGGGMGSGRHSMGSSRSAGVGALDKPPARRPGGMRQAAGSTAIGKGNGKSKRKTALQGRPAGPIGGMESKAGKNRRNAGRPTQRTVTARPGSSPADPSAAPFHVGDASALPADLLGSIEAWASRQEGGEQGAVHDDDDGRDEISPPPPPPGSDSDAVRPEAGGRWASAGDSDLDLPSFKGSMSPLGRGRSDAYSQHGNSRAVDGGQDSGDGD